MIEAYRAGVQSVVPDASIEIVHLYGLNYKGCLSCFGCKRDNSPSYGHCVINDDLKPLFEKTAGTYDVPIYERTVTAYARFGDWLPFLLLFMWAAFYAGTLPIFNAVHVRTRCLRQALLPHRPIRD